MFGWNLEIWNVRNDGSDPAQPVDTLPRVERNKVVLRNDLGQFVLGGAIRFRERKAENNVEEKTGSRVSRRATGLRLVK